MVNYEIKVTPLFLAILYPCFLSKLIRRLVGEEDEISDVSENPPCSDFVDALVFNPEVFENSRTILVSPEAYSLPYEIIQISAIDGVNLMGYLILQQDRDYTRCPTVIFYHGNSGNIGDRLLCAKKFHRALKVNVFLIEYRGFGFSQGHASEHGVYQDAQAAFDYVDGRADLDSSQIIVFGRSLGGAIAIDLASRPDYKHRVAVLVIENTFSSIKELARNILPTFLLPVVKIFRLTNKFANYEKISKIVRPTLFISGKEDKLISPEHMTKLYMGCRARKKIIRFHKGDHMSCWTQPGYTHIFGEFLEESTKRFPVSKIPMKTLLQYRKDEDDE